MAELPYRQRQAISILSYQHSWVTSSTPKRLLLHSSNSELYGLDCSTLNGNVEDNLNWSGENSLCVTLVIDWMTTDQTVVGCHVNWNFLELTDPRSSIYRFQRNNDSVFIRKSFVIESIFEFTKVDLSLPDLWSPSSRIACWAVIMRWTSQLYFFSLLWIIYLSTMDGSCFVR